MSARVLVVDDHREWAESRVDDLTAEGYEVAWAATREAALTQVVDANPHVVLLDKGLLGATDRSGLTLLEELRAAHPATQVIMVTAYADESSILRAFELGAWDYLVKDKLLRPLLRAKLPNAVEAAERMMSAPSPAQLEAELQSLWTRARASTVREEKGPLLEKAIRALFRTIPGLEKVDVNLRTSREELDVVVFNESDHPALQRHGRYLVVEAKNWTGKVGAPEFRVLRDKVRNKHRQCTLGILVAPNGFSEPVQHLASENPMQGEVFLTLDGDDLDAWVGAPDRLAWLVGRVDAAIVGS